MAILEAAGRATDERTYGDIQCRQVYQLLRANHLSCVCKLQLRAFACGLDRETEVLERNVVFAHSPKAVPHGEPSGTELL